jgi:hypothetical protein
MSDAAFNDDILTNWHLINFYSEKAGDRLICKSSSI